MPGPVARSLVSPDDSTPDILAFGEILWDVLPDGEVIGGAPFNVAAHAVGCGLRASLYSRVGRDARGRRAEEAVRKHGVDARWLQVDSARPTGWVEVALDAQGQPSYRIVRGVAWDAMQAPGLADEAELKRAGFSALICGTLAQRSKVNRTTLAALRRLLPDVPVCYDINLRGTETPLTHVAATLPGVTVLKINDDEAAALGRGLWRRSLDLPALFRHLAGDFRVQILVCTHGARGCSVLQGNEVIEVAGAAVKVASAVGAGDAFCAAFLAGWLRGASLRTAAENANALGAFVASQRETVPAYPPALLARLRVNE